MNLITPVILIIISLGVFFTYTDPNYRGQNLSSGQASVLELGEKNDEYLKALNNVNEIKEKTKTLVEKKGNINTDYFEKLEKLLPDNIDNIKLVIDLNEIAKQHGLILKGVNLDIASKSGSGQLGKDNNKYGTVGLSFSVSSTYDNFQNFLGDLERSLRLIDITDLSVSGSDAGVYDFSISLKTYWLK